MPNIPIPTPRPKPTISAGPPLSHSFFAHTLTNRERDRYMAKSKLNPRAVMGKHLITVTIEGQEPVTVAIPRTARMTHTQAHKAAFAAAKVQLKIA